MVQICLFKDFYRYRCAYLDGLHWALLVRQKGQVQPVFIITVMTMLLFLIVSMTLYYAGSLLRLPALLLYLGGYSFCWLVFYSYEKQIVAFIENAAEKLSWVDPLIGSIPHTDLALRNTCSFSLGLLNLIYVYTLGGGGAVNIVTLILVGLSLFTNVLIGLRLIKTSASVKLETSFMLQIIKHGYSNITTIYGQLKKKQLPKATWYGWVIALTMGVTLISPAYAGQISTDGASTMGVSGSGAQPSNTGEGEAVLEGAAGSRVRQGAQRLYQHTVDRLGQKAMDAPADAAAGVVSAAAGYAGAAAYQATMGAEQPTANVPTELEAATERATKAEVDANAARADANAARNELAAKNLGYIECALCVSVLQVLVMMLVITSEFSLKQLA